LDSQASCAVGLRRDVGFVALDLYPSGH